MSVKDEEQKEKRLSTGGSKKAKSINSKKPPLISNNNDLGNLKEPSVSDQNQPPMLSVISSKESIHSSLRSRPTSKQRPKSSASTHRPSALPKSSKTNK